jgi:hypothetical protein
MLTTSPKAVIHKLKSFKNNSLSKSKPPRRIQAMKCMVGDVDGATCICQYHSKPSSPPTNSSSVSINSMSSLSSSIYSPLPKDDESKKFQLGFNHRQQSIESAKQFDEMISQGFKNNETEEIHYTLILTMTPKLVRL